MKVGQNYGQTDGQMDGQTDSPITICLWQTLKAWDHKNYGTM